MWNGTKLADSVHCLPQSYSSHRLPEPRCIATLAGSFLTLTLGGHGTAAFLLQVRVCCNSKDAEERVEELTRSQLAQFDSGS